MEFDQDSLDLAGSGHFPRGVEELKSFSAAVSLQSTYEWGAGWASVPRHCRRTGTN